MNTTTPLTSTEISARLTQLQQLALLRSAEVELALALGARAGAEPCLATVVLAFAVRGPAEGQVCVDLSQLVPWLRNHPELKSIAWPDMASWEAALAACPLVGPGVAKGPSTPLVRQGTRLFLDRYYRYLHAIASDLRARAQRIDPAPQAEQLKACLAQLFPEGDRGPELDRQLLACVLALLHRLAIISGGPGTGKTTTVTKLMAAILMTQPPGAPPLRIALAAPTGKAAARMQASVAEGVARLPLPDTIREALAGIQASTLHRLLGRRGDHSSRFRFNAERQLPYDLVIVDEATMVSMAMMARLLEALAPDTRLILLGDREQLASVEAGAVFAECSRQQDQDLRCSKALIADIHGLCGYDWQHELDPVNSPGLWDCSVQLTRYHRFDSQSGIARWTRALRQLPELRDDQRERGRQRIHAKLIELTQRSDDGVQRLDHEGNEVPKALADELHTHYLALARRAEAAQSQAELLQLLEELDDTRVLAPHREGPLGVQAINSSIETRLLAGLEIQPARSPRADSTHIWYPGRPVMVTQNDYAVGLFNGDIGITIRDPEQRGRLVVAFPPAAGGDLSGDETAGGPRLIALSRLPACESVFCMSIHKSQGSQFRHAVVVMPLRDSPILSRELIYTGLTRARERASIVGATELLALALSRTIRRESGLRELLWSQGPESPSES